MNPFFLVQDQEPDPPFYGFTKRTLEASIRRPPCECAECENSFYPVEKQRHAQHSYHLRLSDAVAERNARSLVQSIHRSRGQLSDKIKVFGDVLMSRWKKRSQTKRAALLKEAVPDLEEQQWLIPRYSYTRESLYMRERTQIRRRQLLLPWLNVHVLKTNPAVLFALLHYRTAYPPQSWASFDNRQLILSWGGGYFDVDFSPKCVVMYGPRYGSLVNWEAEAAHFGETLGYPRAMLVLEAQAHLLETLCTIVNKILDGVDPLQEPRTEKWHDLVSQEAFRETGAVEFWSPYTNQAFSRPPTFNCDYLIALAKSRLDEIGDHLWYLQCDDAYIRRYVKMIVATENFKKAPKHLRAMMVTQRAVLDFHSYCWWRWIEMECKHVDAVRKRFRDSIHPGSPLPPKYDKAVGALGLLLLNQVTYRITLLEELLPYIPGMQQHWELDPSQLPSDAPSDAVGMTKRITPQNTQQSLADDPLDWCLVQLQGKPDNENYFDHAMLFSMLQDHLSSNPSEGKRLDEVTYRTLSDLSASHEILVAVLSHTPRNTARHLHDVIAQEDRECWKSQQPFDIDGVVFERIGKAFMRDFFDVKPSTGPKSPDSISQSRALRIAVEKFWESIRAFLRKDLTRSGPGFTQEEVDSLLGVVSANLSAEYIDDEQRAQAEMFAAIHITDEPQSMIGTFNEIPEPSSTPTTIAQGRDKVKTRGEQCSSANDVTEPPAETAEEVTKHAVISLTRESLGVIHLMFPSKDNVAKEVTWDRFVRVMIEAGFTARNNSGSAVAFKQLGEGGRIVFHKPHPADKIDPVLLRIMGKRMAKWFGWKRELFALQGEATSGV
ncbi:ycfA domain-containing protein [Fusarium pseudoanthophilum]|uniref:YcfA domain-containing protein n=1 Tax=Fusarium pseudoanthophilum TaxID=48495 RepID=A0A8H5P0X6_9HYPO|nr:ycfA domain-containing protein [Fusarium pseudoanthophilum]